MVSGQDQADAVTKRVRMIVKGRVQRVGFRASCARHGQSLGLAGSVRNLADGSVEVVTEGDATAVDEMIRWCQSGPPYSQVRAVECTTETPVGEETFRIKRF